MAVLPIVTGQDNPILLRKSEKVEIFGKELRGIITDLIDTMHHAKGAGLAAPQVNLSLAVCIASVGGKPTVLVNPEIAWESKEASVMEEGCLSLPDCWIEIERPRSIIVRYQNENGKTEERKLENFDARVVQHEIDHLKGVLITQHPRRVDAKALKLEGRLEA